MTRWRIGISRSLVLYLLGVVAAWMLFPATAQAAEGRLAFVVRNWFIAQHNSRFADECPEGVSQANDELWWRGLSKKDREKLTDNGLIQVLDRNGIAMRRGPKGEDVCVNPDVVTDPPLRIIRGKYSYGANLDGTTDGRATPKTCAHEKFIGMDGTPAIDNQLYRLVGCTYGWRKAGIMDLLGNETRVSSGLGMILIEITGVTDPRNSDDVTVSFYRSTDQFTLDSGGLPLSFSSYRIDMADGKPRYGDSVKGRIKNGVLETQRGDVRLPFYGNYNFLHPTIKDLGLKLEIAADGRTASGMITGYHDVEQFMYWVLGQGIGLELAHFSCPAMYVAAKKLADGYPDPKTGECTMISSAFKINTTAAFAVHPKADQKQAAR
jgi:hypothetical protein